MLAHRISRRRRPSGQSRGTVPRHGPGKPGLASRSTIHLVLAPSSPCPHCGRTTKTVQGVCADCWGSKGGRPFGVRKQGPDTSELQELLGFDPLHPGVLTAVAIGIPVLLALLLWILG